MSSIKILGGLKSELRWKTLFVRFLFSHALLLNFAQLFKNHLIFCDFHIYSHPLNCHGHPVNPVSYHILNFSPLLHGHLVFFHFQILTHPVLGYLLHGHPVSCHLRIVSHPVHFPDCPNTPIVTFSPTIKPFSHSFKITLWDQEKGSSGKWFEWKKVRVKLNLNIFKINHDEYSFFHFHWLAP